MIRCNILWRNEGGICSKYNNYILWVLKLVSVANKKYPLYWMSSSVERVYIKLELLIVLDLERCVRGLL